MANTSVNIDITVQTKSLKELEEELNDINEELRQVAVNSDDFKILSQRAQDATKALREAEQAAEGFTDEQKFMAADGAIKVLAGSLQTAVGALGALGVESEIFGEFEKRAASVIAFGIGIKDLSEGYKQLKDSTLLANAALKTGNALNKATTVTMKALGIAAKTTSNSFKVLRGAIAATGIGLLAIGIGEIVNKLQSLKKEADLSSEGLSESIGKASSNVKKSFRDIDSSLAALRETQKFELQEYTDSLGNAADAEIKIEKKRLDQQKIFAKAISDATVSLGEQADTLGVTLREANKEYGDFLAGTTTNLRTLAGFDEDGEWLATKVERLQNDFDAILSKRLELTQAETEAYNSLGQTSVRITEEERRLANERESIIQELALSRQTSYQDQSNQINAFYDSLEKRIKEANYTQEEETQVLKQVTEARKATLQELTNAYQAAAINQEVAFRSTLQAVQNETKAQEIAGAEEEILRMNSRFEARMQVLQANYLLEAEMIDQQRDNELLALDAALKEESITYQQYQQLTTAIKQRGEEQRLTLDKTYNNLRLEMAAQAVEEEMGLAMLRVDIAAQAGESILGLLQEVFGESKALAAAAIVVEKAAAIAQIIANTAIANAKLVAAFPITLGQPWVGINTAGAVASIATTVLAAGKAIGQLGETNSGPNSASTAGLNTPNINAQQAPVTQNIQERAPQQITATPITRTYVLTGDVTSGMEAEAKLNTKRTIV